MFVFVLPRQRAPYSEERCVKACSRRTDPLMEPDLSVADRYSPDLYDLYGLAHVAGWGAV